MKSNVLIANFGNGSIAMIQWAIELSLENVLVLSVDTGWASQAWHTRYDVAFEYLNKHNIAYKHLPASQSFADSVRERGSFPSKKFQWCAPFLKGLVLNEILDELDPFCEATIYLSKIRCLSRANQQLTSGLVNEHYADRQLNYPLLEIDLATRDALIKRAGFTVLPHTSQECLPCIHSSIDDKNQMHERDIVRLNKLEQALGQQMLMQPSSHAGAEERYDMGCGNIWGCGE